jgi:membrane protein
MALRTDVLTDPATLWDLLKNAAKEWNQDEAPRLGASLAYYAVFSLAPLLVIALSIAGLVFGREAATGQVVEQIQGLIGRDAAVAVQEIIKNTSQPSAGILASLIGLIMLLFGASGVFNELEQSMNRIWDVPPKPSSGLWTLIRDRFLSFLMVLGTGFLLLVSLIISAVLAALGEFFLDLVPGLSALVHVLNFVVSLAVITGLFALIFKYVPQAEIAWEDVWIGAALTAILFTIGKVLISLYIGHSSFSSAYGAAASFVVILLWVYYSSQILFFGAEFTQVYANTYGSRIRAESTGQLTQPSVGPAAGKPPDRSR